MNLFSNQNYRDLDQIAIASLFKAIKNHFSHCSLFGSAILEFGFYVDVVLPQNCNHELLYQLERGLFSNVSKEPVDSGQMVKSNAIEYFKYHNEPYLEKAISKQKNDVISLVKVGESYFPACFSLGIKNLKLEHLKLLDFEERKTNNLTISRLYGAVATSSKELKSIIKSIAISKRYSYQKLGESLKLYATTKNQKITLPKELFIYEQLRTLIKTFYEKNKFQIVDISSAYLSTTKKDFLRKISFYFSSLPSSFSTHNYYSFLSDNDEKHDISLTFTKKTDLVSHLNQILERFKSFSQAFQMGLEFTYNCKDHSIKSMLSELLIKEAETNSYLSKFCSLRIDFYWIDTHSRKRRGGFLEILILNEKEFNKNHYLIVSSLAPNLNFLISILCEHYKGRFPFWMQDEQVRILEDNSRNAHITKSLLKTNFRVFIDERKTFLEDKVIEAKKEKVPFSICIGNNEKKPIEIQLSITKKQNYSSIEAFLRILNKQRNPLKVEE